jgi:hypothetical protein
MSKLEYSKILIFIFLFLFNCETKQKKKNLELVAGFFFLNQTRQVAPSVQFQNPDSIADLVTQAPNHNGDDGSFRNSVKAINGIRGGGLNSGGLDVFSLTATGNQAVVVLEWRNKKILNGSGIDFIIFENPFLYNNNPNTVFMEPIIVEVSLDNQNYCGFSPNYTNANETVYANNPNLWQRFAGLTPVKYNVESNSFSGNDLFDISKVGGDGFDLDNLSQTNDFSIGCSSSLRDEIRTNGFVYLRLVAASSRINPDTSANFLQDTGAFGGGPDIDGVIARYRTNR